jgi:histidine triad (HIT) family protein
VTTLFTKIIEGEIPGRFVWKDDRCVAFLTIAPLRPGHTLVVPREEVDHWIDAEPELLTHLMSVARDVARGIDKAWSPLKVGLAIIGLEVPHLHVHVSPIWEMHDLDFDRQDKNPDPKDLDTAAEKLRGALRELGCAHVSD